jgi:hypothetical protein
MLGRGKGRNGADPFVVALARLNGCTAVAADRRLVRDGAEEALEDVGDRNGRRAGSLLGCRRHTCSICADPADADTAREAFRSPGPALRSSATPASTRSMSRLPARLHPVTAATT